MVQAALIVDAHPTQLATTAQLLTYAGYSVTAVSTFEEARARLSTIQDLSLLVADVRLGQYNGLHLALRARALHPNVRVIITDRTFDAALQSEAERIGVAYAAKPLTSQQLADLLARLSAASQPASSRVRRWPRKHVADRIPAEVGARKGLISTPFSLRPSAHTISRRKTRRLSSIATNWPSKKFSPG